MYEYLKKHNEEDVIQVLYFNMNGVYYGIPVELFVKEVAMFDESNFKKTIETQENVIGSVILRDKMIAILDLKEKYNIKEDKSKSYEKSIVVLKSYGKEEEKLLGLLIEDKLDIKDIYPSKIEKKQSSLKEIYGYTKINIDGKDDFLAVLDGNVFFKFKKDMKEDIDIEE